MSLSKPNHYKDGSGWYKTGKMFNFSCRIVYDAWGNTYSYIVKKDNQTYNSLWDDKSFSTEDGCRIACEDYCKSKKESER